MSTKRIAIIGAGISGLLACKHAQEKGFSPVVFEARPDIGGVWAQTIESTKLQTPKNYYRFSDFAWPGSVTGPFPDHAQVMEYIRSYAVHFNLLRRIQFNSRVIGIDYFGPSDDDDDDIRSWDLWGGEGGEGGPFSLTGKWNVTVQDARDPSAAPQVYQVDFVILCIGKFSDVPNIPPGEDLEVFKGQVIHSMDYAAMGDDQAAAFIKGKRTVVVGFQKSAVDVAAQVATKNGPRHPCTLLFRTVHWTIPEHLHLVLIRNLNRFSELMIHKPNEGFFSWLLALLLSPLLWIFSKLVESYLRWIYPLKKHNMIPGHGFLRQVSSCMFTILPTKFYDKVEEGSLILQQSQKFSFRENGLVLANTEDTPLETDIVILATGYKSDDKLKNIFTSTYFQTLIAGSAPFYRECIHPRIPQLGILGYSESPTILHTTEMRSKWLAHFLAGKFELPTIREMEEDVKSWEKCMRQYVGDGYKRSCVSVSLQIHCNDQLCRDMGCNPRRKKWFLSELVSPYGPTDYTDLT